MKYRLGCELAYDVTEETNFIFNIEVARLPRHLDLRDRIDLSHDVAIRTHTEPATGSRYFSALIPAGAFSLRYSAEVDLAVRRADPASVGEMPIGEVPLDLLPYLLPSRFVPSDRLSAFATREFGEVPGGHARITQICNWIHDHLEYRRGTSDAETVATEVLVQRAGVCRDFAHLGIAFCRALGVPARYVTCYAHGLSPDDFHAVFEAYLDGQWWLFDATRQAELDGLVRIGVGRDAAEVAIATIFGSAVAGPVKVWMEATGQPSPLRTTDAVGTDGAIGNEEARPRR
jgi:transglutaminase-like putative cysteine protease